MTQLLPVEIQAARLKLISQRPYLAKAVYSMVPIPKSGLGTMAVDKFWRLYFDPDLGSKWTISEISGVLYHEVLHLLRGHPERMGQYSVPQRVLNIAADLEINDDLKVEQISLPEGGIFPEELGFPPNLTAEEYLLLLQSQDSGGSNDDDDRPRPGAGRCGSCATGKRETWELPEPDADNPGIGELDSEIIRRQVAEEIKNAAHRRGDIPGHLRRWAEVALRPKVDWRRKLQSALRRAMASAGLDDYTYSRPNRRSTVVFPVILPGKQRANPEVAIVVDTSGSMSERKLAQALAEIRGVLVHSNGSVRVIVADAAVHWNAHVSDVKKILPHLKGGGGTNMAQAILQADRLRPRPGTLIVLTDGDTPWPDAPPKGIRVVVGLILEKDENPPQTPSWATVVEIR